MYILPKIISLGFCYNTSTYDHISYSCNRTTWRNKTSVKNLQTIYLSGFISWGDVIVKSFTETVCNFNPGKVPWNWIAFYLYSVVISSGLLYHLIRRETLDDLQTRSLLQMLLFLGSNSLAVEKLKTKKCFFFTNFGNSYSLKDYL